jgi:hypothetical protein
MTTAEVVAERALGSAAASGVDDETAIREILDLAGERRVAVVRARQLLGDGDGAADDATIARAMGILDQALARIPV